MQDSPQRDSAVSGYARSISYRDPAAAIDWANTIGNTKVREDSLVRYGRIYMQRDRKAASQWLSRSNLSPGLQKRITPPPRR